MGTSIVHDVGGKGHPLEIRWSTDEDLIKILEWLNEEDRAQIHGNFLCNWRLTQQFHENGRLLVLIDKLQAVPVGYQWGQLLQPGILQIRNEWRGKGLGRLVVEHCVELAQQQDEAVLLIECKPASSIPFWKRMGFEIVEGAHGGNAEGYRVLSKKLELPGNGEPVEVRVSSYPEEKKWKPDTPPLSAFSPTAVRDSDGLIHLNERAAFISGGPNGIGDLVIEILMDNAVIYCDKAKYEAAEKHGVQRCENGFFVDLVLP
ncbi:MAG: N-acetyltransferase [Nitrospirales bacterium]|nr:MAG: N-acetyltransferase [Nitrospirales bacterium]